MSDQAQTSTDEGAKPDEDGTETPSTEDLLKKIEDLTAESRKWESRSKANKSAADELAALKTANMTDAEKAEAEKAEHATRLTEAESRAEKAEAALARFTIATEFGLSKDDAEALASVSDPDALRALAERLADRSTGPKPNPAQGRAGAPAPTTPGAAFADALGELF